MTIDQTTLFMKHIRDHATQYFEDIQSLKIQVQLAEKQVRPSSLLYQFTVGDEKKNHAILVKVPHSLAIPVNGCEDSLKPRLYPKTDPKDMPRLEYTALRTIDDYFSTLDKKDLGTIRVLDYLPEHNAIVTVVSRDQNLRQLFEKTNRFLAPFTLPELQLVFQNTGRWLSHYHRIAKEENVLTRHASRDDYIEAVIKMADFLATAHGDRAYFQEITSTLESLAFKFLPGSLPLGLGHGDFAMRNVLVGQNARITVIDTYAKWRTTIYEDIGYFLNGLKMTGPQVISQGLMFSPNQLAKYERAFLEGYFGQKRIPYNEIRLYEMLVRLDKWASIIAYSQQGRARFKAFRKIKIILTSRYFKKTSKQLLDEIKRTG
jgi:hypothetical protein